MQQISIEGLTYQDMLRPEMLADPYPLFRRLRDESPVHEDENGGAWIVSRYRDVAFVLSDPRFSAARLLDQDRDYDGDRPIRSALSRQMLFLDPPDHTRLRKLFAKAFTPIRLESLRPHIQHIIDHLLDKAEISHGYINFIRDFAVPLPVTVIAQILGVPHEDRPLLLGWSGAFGQLISGRRLTAEEVQEADRGIREFIGYFQDLIDKRRRHPADDMLSDLVVVEEMGDRLSTEELIMNLILLLAAGHGTTTHLLGNGLLALLSHPAEWQRLVADQTIAPHAVSELLRFDAPVQVTGREALEDVELGGKIIRKGQRARVLLGSANRDEERFPAPDRLDLQRSDTRVMSFGHGIHTCLGAMLARLEAQIAFAELARRYPAAEFNPDTLQRSRSVSFRGLSRLDVRLS
ncbi:MAG TPA: cytochrome P450 [Acidocella sp.]|uniref:cytochrome P450 n=1 Tax=Acidocella sp. TaxID=50710 RepID=UPI002C09BEAF|nr:cytochrome P450 [Acidocella sp.]HVE20450.1 cytochrome P450 [Acidocella sp.]